MRFFVLFSATIYAAKITTLCSVSVACSVSRLLKFERFHVKNFRNLLLLLLEENDPVIYWRPGYSSQRHKSLGNRRMRADRCSSCMIWNITCKTLAFKSWAAAAQARSNRPLSRHAAAAAQANAAGHQSSKAPLHNPPFCEIKEKIEEKFSKPKFLGVGLAENWNGDFEAQINLADRSCHLRNSSKICVWNFSMHLSSSCCNCPKIPVMPPVGL